MSVGNFHYFLRLKSRKVKKMDNKQNFAGGVKKPRDNAFVRAVKTIFVKDWALKAISIVAGFVFWLVMSIS